MALFYNNILFSPNVYAIFIESKVIKIIFGNKTEKYRKELSNAIAYLNADDNLYRYQEICNFLYHWGHRGNINPNLLKYNGIWDAVSDLYRKDAEDARKRIKDLNAEISIGSNKELLDELDKKIQELETYDTMYTELRMLSPYYDKFKYIFTSLNQLRGRLSASDLEKLKGLEDEFNTLIHSNIDNPEPTKDFLS